MWSVRHTTAAVLVTSALTLAGCANLEAVRDFSKTAAQVTSYPDAGAAFEASARLGAAFHEPPLLPVDKAEVRHAQVDRALKVQAALAGYFAALAKLSGEDSFSLDAQLDQVGKGLQALPDAQTSAEIQAAVSLAKIASNHLLSEKQAQAVKALVHDGGPGADKVTQILINVTRSWQMIAESDKSNALSTLGGYAGRADTPKLAAILANDRAMHLDSEFSQLISRIGAAESALVRVSAAHKTLEETVDSVPPAQWGGLLKAAIADLKTARGDIQALH